MAIVTRQTTSPGVVNRNKPLTNAEIDNNFIELFAGKLAALLVSGNGTIGTSSDNTLDIKATLVNGLTISGNVIIDGTINSGTNEDTFLGITSGKIAWKVPITSSSAPSNPINGQLWLESTSQKLYTYSSSQSVWIERSI